MKLSRIVPLLVASAVAPAVASAQSGSITSNFNGTSISAGSDIWFNSVFKVTGAVDGTQLHFSGSHITFTASSTNYDIAIPDAVITFSSAVSTATTTFDGSKWITFVPLGFADNVWLSGLAWAVPTSLPGGINPVTWSWDFVSSTTDVSVQWKWAAAVYSQSHSGCGTGDLTSSENDLGVKPLHSTSLDSYHNGHQAGTTENFTDTDCWIGGARGGGSSNFTGSYSGTQQVPPGTYVTPEPATIVLLATGMMVVGLAVVVRRGTLL